jgi:hypothetical protein
MPLNGHDKLAFALCHVVNERLRNAQGTHGVDVEHLRPGLVIDVPDALASGSADASVIEEEVNGLPG